LKIAPAAFQAPLWLGSFSFSTILTPSNVVVQHEKIRHYGIGENDMIFRVTLEQAEDGWIVAECPALPGCVSQGEDEQEALENVKEAITAWLWAEDQKAIAALPQSGQLPIVVSV
jgi:predicted RNase H-like HicB family nuclease